MLFSTLHNYYVDRLLQESLNKEPTMTVMLAFIPVCRMAIYLGAVVWLFMKRELMIFSEGRRYKRLMNDFEGVFQAHQDFFIIHKKPKKPKAKPD
jgi:hypothetical protein